MHDKVGRIEIMIVCKDGVVLDWVPQALYTAAIFKHPRKGRACIEDGRLQLVLCCIIRQTSSANSVCLLMNIWWDFNMW
jgi:hypothetical protein